MVAERSRRSLADELGLPATRRSLRDLPALAGGAVKLVWCAARRTFLATLSIQVARAILLGIQVLAGKYLLQQILRGPANELLHRAIGWLIVLAIVYTALALVAVVQLELQRLLSELVSRHSVQMVIDAGAAVDLISYEDPVFHDRLQRAIVNATIRPLQMTTGLLSVGTALASALAVSFALMTIEPWLLLAAVASLTPVTLISVGVGRALYGFAVEQTPHDRQRNYVQQLLTSKESAKEVRAYDLADYLKNRYAKLYDGRIRALLHVIRTRIMLGMGGALLGGLGLAATIGLLIFFIGDRHITVASAGAAVVALLILSGQLQGLASGIGQLYESALYIRDFTSFIEIPTRASTAVDFQPAQPEAIEVIDVSFTYPSRQEPSLSGVNLKIEPGQVIALVGENGSGKTTLAKLLAGLYRPDDGTILWAGRDMDQLGGSVRRRTAVLFQDFLQYFMSAADNIVLGDWRRSEDLEAMLEASRRGGAHSFISLLPSGYETLLGPQFVGGSDLSGGQWQRIALSRAFFRDAELVILDEPTAALDPRGEAELFGTVRELFRGRSVVLITHRFGSARLADYIYVLSKGHIVEHGTHEQLRLAKGRYSELFDLQATTLGLTGET